MRLQGATGGYDKTIPIAGNFAANSEGTVDVDFENVPTTASYSLTYIGGDGTETTIVEKTPYKDLNDNSLPPQSGGAPSPTPEP